MADAAHDRDRVRDDRAHDALVVERPQVLERAAAAGEDRHRRRLVRLPVARRARRSTARAAGSAVTIDAGAAVALDLARDEHDAGHRPAAREDRAHVAPDGAGRRRDDGDRPRLPGQRPLPRRVEQSLRRERGLELLEPDREVAEPRRLERLDVQLQRALRLEHVHPPVGDDLEPGLGLERRPRTVVAEPHALELGTRVLEREVGVARGRHRDPADLALDPQVAQAVVGADALADRPADLGHRPHPEPERAAGDAGARRDSSGSSGSVSQDGSSQSGGSGVPLMRRPR